MRQHDQPVPAEDQCPNPRQGTHLYVDAARGIAGDMLLGALLDLGVPEEAVLNPLAEVLPPFRAFTAVVKKRGITARTFTVETVEHDPPHRTFRTIRALIEASSLPEAVRRRSVEVFEALAIAEAEVHGSTPEDVHFHEVGAIDSLVDIIGTVLAVDILAPTAITFSTLPLGQGTVETQHGVYPIPAPATLALLRGLPTTPYPVAREVTTPTGAALAKVLATSFGPPPAGTIVATGYGAGTRDAGPEEAPNVLRAWTVIPGVAGDSVRSHHPGLEETVVVLETNLDHASGEDVGHLIDRLIARGALDVFVVPTVQKKSRPGHWVTVLCADGTELDLERELFRESGTLGVRRHRTVRRALERTSETVELRGHPVRIKRASLDGESWTAAPEFEDLRQLADATEIPLRQLRAELFAQLSESPKSDDSSEATDACGAVDHDSSQDE